MRLYFLSRQSFWDLRKLTVFFSVNPIRFPSKYPAWYDTPWLLTEASIWLNPVSSLFHIQFWQTLVRKGWDLLWGDFQEKTASTGNRTAKLQSCRRERQVTTLMECCLSLGSLHASNTSWKQCCVLWSFLRRCRS